MKKPCLIPIFTLSLVVQLFKYVIFNCQSIAEEFAVNSESTNYNADANIYEYFSIFYIEK